MSTKDKSAKAAKFLKKENSGMAATEFAMILPIIILLFFGMLEVSDALSVNRRVSHASNAVVDLVGQSERTTPSEMGNIFAGAEKMLEPNDTSTLSMRLTSVIRDPGDATKVIVDWSLDSEGGEPYAVGSDFTEIDDEDVLVEGMSLLVAETSYVYTSAISNRVISPSFTFEKVAKRWPRLNSAVLLCPDADPECTS